MAFYKLHMLNREGLIDRTHEFHAKDDAAAIRAAEVWIECAPMDLCKGVKLVKKWQSRFPSST